MQDVLDQLGLKRIVVGHTSMPHVSSFHGDRIIAIDSSIKDGESGELLFIENGTLSRGLLDGTRVPLAQGEPLQVMRYGVGAEYKPHYDYFDLGRPGQAANLRNGGQRIASLVIYLNDVEAGGETTFPRCGLAVGPRKGSAVFFAYTDAQSRTDPMSFHAGAPVTRGEKWIATRWMRERAFV